MCHIAVFFVCKAYLVHSAQAKNQYFKEWNKSNVNTDTTRNLENLYKALFVIKRIKFAKHAPISLARFSSSFFFLLSTLSLSIYVRLDLLSHWSERGKVIEKRNVTFRKICKYCCAKEHLAPIIQLVELNCGFVNNMLFRNPLKHRIQSSLLNATIVLPDYQYPFSQVALSLFLSPLPSVALFLCSFPWAVKADLLTRVTTRRKRTWKQTANSWKRNLEYCVAMHSYDAPYHDHLNGDVKRFWFGNFFIRFDGLTFFAIEKMQVYLNCGKWRWFHYKLCFLVPKK